MPPGYSSIPSEEVLQRELQLAHIRARGADLAEACGRPVCVGITPVRVVRQVEGLEPELDGVVLGDPEVFVGREVPLDHTGGDDRIAANVAEGSEGLKHESVGIEPALDIPLAAVEEGVLARRIRPVETGAGVRLISARSDGIRETGLER